MVAEDAASFDNFINNAESIKNAPKLTDPTYSSTVYPRKPIIFKMNQANANNLWNISDSMGICRMANPSYVFNKEKVIKCAQMFTDFITCEEYVDLTCDDINNTNNLNKDIVVKSSGSSEYASKVFSL